MSLLHAIMGACQSCLGLRRRENHESEHARLIDDDLYPGGYGYGSINNPNQQQHDPEDLKREREALEAICQRASDTVIDIWALQSQPNFQPRATLPITDETPPSHNPQTPLLDGGNDDHESRKEQTTKPSQPVSSSSNNGGGGGSQKHLSTVPNHWGEVVISPRRKNKNKTGGIDSNHKTGDGDIFGVLRVT